MFENILLKKLLNDSEFFCKVYPILKAKYFKEIGTSKIFELMSKYFGEYHNAPNETVIASMIKDTQNLETRKEIAKSLMAIHKDTEIAQDSKFMVDETIKFVKDAIYLEALTIGSEGLMKKSDTLKLKAQSLFDEMTKVSIDDDLGLSFKDIDYMINYYQTRNVGLLTEHKDLNKRLGTGFLPGTLSIILAGQSVGKSLLMCDLISGMILKGKNVLLVSLEMAQPEMMRRIHANTMNINVNAFSDISKTDDELKQIERPTITKDEILNAYNLVSKNAGEFWVKEYPSGSFSALMLEDLVQRFKTRLNITFDCIFVDYLGIMKSDRVSPSVGLYSYIKSIGEELRASAVRLKVPVISASQLNRGATNKTEADNSAIADSLGTAMTADFMLFLLQNEEMKKNSEIVCKVTKNRFNGRTDTWEMSIDYPHMRFNDMLEQSSGEAVFKQAENEKKGLDKDFGIVTVSKHEKAKTFAETEVKNIHSEAAKVISKKSDDDDILKQLDLL